jgi:hypothetical protein
MLEKRKVIETGRLVVVAWRGFHEKAVNQKLKFTSSGF